MLSDPLFPVLLVYSLSIIERLSDKLSTDSLVIAWPVINNHHLESQPQMVVYTLHYHYLEFIEA